MTPNEAYRAGQLSALIPVTACIMPEELEARLAWWRGRRKRHEVRERLRRSVAAVWARSG